MNNIIDENNTDKPGSKYSFMWAKKLSHLKLKTVETTVEIHEASLEIHSRTLYLGFIKGKMRTKRIPKGNIKKIEQKKLITYTDLIFAAIFFVLGLLNPWLLLLSALFVWTSISNSITITTNLSNVMEIPLSSKKEAQNLITDLKDAM